MLQQGDEIDIWVVEHPLGQGGMGSVYRCHNRSAKRILAAIKTLDPSLNRVASAKARFVREAEILFALDHPNIVKVRNVRMDAELPYIEMEFVSGHSVEAQILRGPMDVARAVALFKQAASALAYMHGMGVRHRDIKPSNMILKDADTLKLVDFGIATEQDGKTLTENGQNFGSVSYAPPEWVEPGTLDPVRWDVYGLGTVFYEMLTGRFAFPVGAVGTSRQQALQVMISKQSHPPLDPGPTIPVALRRLIRAMTRSAPEQRMASADEVLALLEGMDLETVDPSAVFQDTPTLPVSSPTWYPGMDIEEALETPVDIETASQVATPVPLDLETLAPKTPARAAGPAAQGPVESDQGNNKLVLVGCFLGLTVVMAGLGWQVWRSDPSRQKNLDPQPSVLERKADVIIAGLAETVPVQVQIGEQRVFTIDGFVHHFGALPLGEHELRAILGQDCKFAEPAAWCVLQEQTVVLEAGEGVQTLTLSLNAPAEREVQIQGIRGMRLSVDGKIIEVDRKGAAAVSLPPGKYVVQADKGKDNWNGDLVVPADGELPTFQVELSKGEQSGSNRDPVRDAVRMPIRGGVRDPVTPPETPSASGGTAARSQVTNAQLGAWLATHPDWQRDGAAGKASGTYLKGWEGVTPPAGKSGQAAVNVSWSMARAYCSGRGGLAQVGASPQTWIEGGTLAWHEYRQVDGKPAWLRSDGSSSTAVKVTDAKAFIGFRCAR
ncbi:MAG: serine/threonine protein kinase [Cognaticolwellia sp.]